MIVILLEFIGLVCKHAKFKTLVVGLDLQQFQDKIKSISILEVNNVQPSMCSYQLEFLTIYILTMSLMGYILVISFLSASKYNCLEMQVPKCLIPDALCIRHLQVHFYQTWKGIEKFWNF